MQSELSPLTAETYEKAIFELASRDRDLGSIVADWGHPPFWTHEAGFPGIVISILAQQVSLESAEAAFRKLEASVDVTPEQFLTLDERSLKAIGFSRQKTSYVREIARGILDGEVDLQLLETMDDDQARTVLIGLRGIGQWTAEAYLLFALRRPDAWPSGDLALIKTIQEIRKLAAPLSAEGADAIASHWRPWRAVAARMLWHYYLCSRGRAASA